MSANRSQLHGIGVSCKSLKNIATEDFQQKSKCEQRYQQQFAVLDWFPCVLPFKLFLIKRKTRFSFILIQHLKILVFFIKFHITYSYNLPPSHHPHFSTMFSGKLHYFPLILKAIWSHCHEFQKSYQSRLILTATRKYCNKCHTSLSTCLLTCSTSSISCYRNMHRIFSNT